MNEKDYVVELKEKFKATCSDENMQNSFNKYVDILYDTFANPEDEAFRMSDEEVKDAVVSEANRIIDLKEEDKIKFLNFNNPYEEIRLFSIKVEKMAEDKLLKKEVKIEENLEEELNRIKNLIDKVDSNLRQDALMLISEATLDINYLLNDTDVMSLRLGNVYSSLNKQ